MRKCLYTFLALLLGTIIVGCGASKARPTSNASSAGNEVGSSKTYSEFRLGVPTFPHVLLFADTPNYQVSEVQSLVTQSLVEFEPDGKVKPGALTSSMAQPNLTTYVYKLRSGMKFSDGKPVTAADAVYSLNLDLAKESWLATIWADVASVSAQGTSTIVIKLKRPDFAWPYIMGISSQILEKAAAESSGGQKTLGSPSNLPIGSGPWKITSYKPEEGAVLEPNLYWTGQKRPANKIVVTQFKQEATMALALRSGAIDGSEWFVSPKLFENIPGVRRLTAPGVGLSAISMDVDVAPLNNVYVRRAIGYAVNVAGIIKSQYGEGLAGETVTDGAPSQFYIGLGSKSEVDHMLASLPTYKYDVAAAKRELAKSPCAHGCSTTVQVLSSGGEVAEAEIIVNNLNKIGIHAKLQELTSAQSAVIRGTTRSTIEIGEFTNPYPGPDVLADFILPTSEIATHVNSARFSNAEVNRLLVKLSETYNTHTRLELVGRIMKIANEEEPYRPMYTHVEWMELSDKFVFPGYSQWTSSFTPWALEVRLAH
jgi:peptide/nickel transport system substrate-binding protein